MGLPIYAEQGRNGGYKVLTNRVIPPILFTEEEAVSIFFAFQSLSYYRDLPLTQKSIPLHINCIAPYNMMRK